MPKKIIDVVEAGRRPRKGTIAFEIGRDVTFSTAALESYAFARWEPIIYDALVVAAAIEFGDKIVKRPSLGWTRQISIRIPVHEPIRWSAPEVVDALHDAIEFLTGDYWTINFIQSANQAPSFSQNMLPLSVKTRAVTAFSNGMDSRAVGGIIGAKLGDKLVRVRVGTNTSDRPTTNGKHMPFTSIPYDVISSMPNRETSARSRGFKFALVSGIAAYLTDATEIVIPESGQGVFGPALVTVGHVYPDFRNHPLFTRLMERFLKVLLQKSVRYIFPRIWHTKGETLREYTAISKNDDWKFTSSCWKNNQWSSVNGKHRQCGACAACMLRRVSVHAAGLVEAPDTYVCTNMSATTLEEAVDPDFTKFNRAFREYAIAGILHMDHLADMAKTDSRPLVKSHAVAIAPMLGLSPNEAEMRLVALLNRHETEWMSYIKSLGVQSFVRLWARVVE